MQALASAFAGGAFRELETLDLSDNPIGDAGVIALAAALENGALPALEELYLNKTNIGDEGVKALMAACAGSDVLAVRGWRSSATSASTGTTLVRRAWGRFYRRSRSITSTTSAGRLPESSIKVGGVPLMAGRQAGRQAYESGWCPLLWG